MSQHQYLGTAPWAFRLRGRLQHGIRRLLICLCISLAGCGGGPEAAATDWLDALNRGDFEDALELSTEQTKALLNIGNSMGEDLAIGEYEVVSVKQVNDTRAEVVISSSDGETKLDLRKIDGKWKVGFKK